MPKGPSRWRWLTLFAACNLAFWLGVAAVVGLIAGDSLDLGVETSLRQYQATVVAVLDRSLIRAPEAAARRTKAGPIQPTGIDSPSPQSTIGGSGLAMATAAPVLPATQEEATLQAAVTPPPNVTLSTISSSTVAPTPAVLLATPPPLWPGPQTAETLVQSPLLLSNPEFKDLTQMNAEMRRSAVGRGVQIRFQESALNQSIAALVEGNDQVPFRDVHVELKRDQVLVSGSVTVLGFSVTAQITGTLQATNCLPQIDVQSISIEGVDTPDLVQDQVEAMLHEALAWYPADYPLCVQQIVLERGRATVYGACR